MIQRNAHEAIIKTIQENKENLYDFIQGTFPLDIAAAIDYTTLEEDTQTYIQPGLLHFFAPRIYNCMYETGGSRTSIKLALLFVPPNGIIEHPHIKIMQFILSIWQDALDRGIDPKPVIPFLFYHGTEEWTITPLNREVGIPDDILHNLTPDLNIIFCDLNSYSDKQIRKTHFKKEANRIVLLLMKHIHDLPYLIENLDEILSLGDIYFDLKEGLKFVKNLVVYLCETTEIPAHGLISSIEKISSQGGEVAMNTAMELRRQGIQEGLKRGKIEDAKKMLQKRYHIDDIMEITNLPLETLTQLIATGVQSSRHQIPWEPDNLSHRQHIIS